MDTLKKLIVLSFLIPSVAWGAWELDWSSGDYFKMADGAYTTLPDGDWTIAGWVKRSATGNTTQAYEWFISTGDWSTDPSYHILMTGGSGGDEGKFGTKGLTDDEDWESLSQGTAYLTDTNWHHIMMIRNGETLYGYVDNNQVYSRTATGSYGGANPTTDMCFGCRNAASPVANRYFDGHFAEWAYWSGTAAGASMRSGLAGGDCPDDYPTNLTWYIPMDEDPTSSMTEEVGGYTLTNGGAAQSTHPASVCVAGSGITLPLLQGLSEDN